MDDLMERQAAGVEGDPGSLIGTALHDRDEKSQGGTN